MSEEMVELFIEARDHIHNTIAQKIETFLLGTWDPLTKHQLIKATIDLIHNEVVEAFPELPEENIPRCRIRVFEETHEVEVGIQNYFNHETSLTFLGTSTMGDEMFDFYCRRSYDPRFDYVFIAKNGHGSDDYVIGSKTAAAEYYLGQITPLSIAFGLAVEGGFIG